MSRIAPRWRRWLAEVFKLVLAMVLVSLALDWWRAPVPSLQAATVPLALSDGRYASLQDLSRERPLLLYFWGSWCGICRHVSPTLDRLAAEGYPVVGVALQSGSEAEVIAYMHRHGWSFTNVHDGDGAWSRQWQIAAAPTVVVVRNGQVHSATTGLSSPWGLKLRFWLAQLP